MKRSSKLALSLVLAAGVVTPVLAQDNFPDVPANHWAYEALQKMKAEGLLVGYPDGLYRGPRPASRYELAVAMHAVYTNLKNLIDGMQTQLDVLKQINPQDIQNLKDQVASLQNQINAMKGWGDDIAALKRATEQFDRELKSLGVDVEAMKKDLGDLADRVTKLEKRKPAVDISGDLTLFAGMGNATNGHPGLDQDGRTNGLSGGGAAGGLYHDLATIHEGAFTFTGTNDTGPKWKATLVVGNAFGSHSLGNQGSLIGSGGSIYSYQPGNEDVYIQDLSAKWDNFLFTGLSAEIGRVAEKLSPYLFQRINPSSYFSNERWADGKYRLDGAILGFNFGSVKLHVWGGNNSNEFSVDGIDLNPAVIANNRVAGGPSETIFGTLTTNTSNLATIPGQIDQTLAADATFALGGHGHVSLAYLLLQNNGSHVVNSGGVISGYDDLLGFPANRDALYGGDANFKFGRLGIGLGFHQSDIQSNGSNVDNVDNQAYNADVSYGSDKFNIWGGYRQIDNNYYAPGDWGKIGILQNPANIKGFKAGLHWDLNPMLALSAGGEWDKGVRDEGGSVGTPFYSIFNSNSKINAYNARLDVRLNPHISVYGGYEFDQFKSYNAPAGDSNTADADYGWATIGLGYGLSANAKLNIAYEFSNVGNEFLLPGATGGRYTGGFLTSQLSIKF